METTVDRFGRIVIPKPVRDDLGLDAGTVLEIQRSGSTLMLRVQCRDQHLARESGVLVYTGKAVSKLERAVERQRRQREREVAAGNSP